MVAAPDLHLPARMTIEQWADMDEDEPGEFVDGYLVEEEVPDITHECIVAWLAYSLRCWGKPRRAFIFASEVKFAVSERRGRKPDVSMYPPGARLKTATLARVPPMLMVEILTPTARDIRRDKIEKMAEYAQFGVPSYWIVDPTARQIEFYQRSSDGKYEHVDTATNGKVCPPGFDGLTLDMDDLWGEVDLLVGDDGESSA